MRSAASQGASCSQTRMTCHPASASIILVSESRSLLRCSFIDHQSPFAVGLVPCSGHTCQKHPSTKTARRRPGNAISILRLRLPGRGHWRRKRRPLAWRARRSATSGSVSAILCRDIRLDTSGALGSGGLLGIGQSRTFASHKPIAMRRQAQGWRLLGPGCHTGRRVLDLWWSAQHGGATENVRPIAPLY